MRYVLHRHGWPIADHLIPVGVIIDTTGGKAADDPSRWALGLAPPPNAIPLDDEAEAAVHGLYGGRALARGAEPGPGLDGFDSPRNVTILNMR